MTRLLHRLSSAHLSAPERVLLSVGGLASVVSLVVERIVNG